MAEPELEGGEIVRVLGIIMEIAEPGKPDDALDPP